MEGNTDDSHNEKRTKHIEVVSLEKWCSDKVLNFKKASVFLLREYYVSICANRKHNDRFCLTNV